MNSAQRDVTFSQGCDPFFSRILPALTEPPNRDPDPDPIPIPIPAAIRHLILSAKSEASPSDLLQSAVYLQCYLRPFGGIDQVARATYQVRKDGKSRLMVGTLPRGSDGQPSGEPLPLLDQSVSTAVEIAAYEVVRLLEVRDQAGEKGGVGVGRKGCPPKGGEGIEISIRLSWGGKGGLYAKRWGGGAAEAY